MGKLKVYGIKNCNTVKKALNWLEEHKVEYEFQDFKKLGIESHKIQEWQKKTNWQNLINKRGTTWRKLSPEVQAGVTSEKEAEAVMIAHTSLIKRPVVEGDSVFLLGFDPVEYEEQLG